MALKEGANRLDQAKIKRMALQEKVKPEDIAAVLGIKLDVVNTFIKNFKTEAAKAPKAETPAKK